MDRLYTERRYSRGGTGKRRHWRQRCELRRSFRVGGDLCSRRRNKRYPRLDIARRREIQRGWESCYRTPKRRACEAPPIGLVNEPEES